MSVTASAMVSWCRKFMGAEPGCPKLPLDGYMKGIPRMECLGKSAQRNGGFDPRRRGCKARKERRRGRHPAAFDERNAAILPRQGLEDRDFRAYRAGAGKIVE